MSIQSEFSGSLETEEEIYDKVYDETQDKIDNFLSSSIDLENYITFKDPEGNILTDTEISEEYADKVSQNEDTKGYFMEANLSVGYEIETAAQARALGLEDGTHGFPSDWQFDNEEVTIKIPLESFLNDPNAQEALEELKDNIEITADAGVIDSGIVDQMFEEASGKIIGETDKRVTSADLSSFDAEDWEYENPVENFENEEEWRKAKDDYVSEQHDYYMSLFNENNTREAFNELLDQGEIYLEDVSYNKYAKEFSLSFEDQKKLMSKILEEYS